MKTENAIYGTAAIVLALFVCPLIVLNSNSREFQHHDIVVTAGVALGITLLGILVVLLLLYILARAGFPYSGLLVRSVFFFLASTVLFFPLTMKAGQVEIDRIALNTENLGISCALALLLLAATQSRLRTSIMIGSIAVVTVNLAVQISSLTTRFVRKDFDALYTASSTRNVFVLSLDGVPRDIAVETIRQDPALAATFKDFTIFQHAIASSPGTFDSVMAEISGIANLKPKFPTSDALGGLANAPGLIPNRFESQGYEVAAYGMYAAGLTNKARRFGISTLSKYYTHLERMEQVTELYQYAVVRMLSSDFVFDKNRVTAILAHLGVSDRLDKTQADDIENQNRLSERTRNHLGAKWDISDIMTLVDFRIYLRNMKVGTSKPVAQFGHFLFTHFPVDLDSECNYQSDVPGWFDSRQDREGLKDQTRCALRSYGLFIEKLRSLGIYDKSLIVLKSDHGEPPKYFDQGGYASFTIRNHEYWGFARYAPFLAFKNFDTHADAPRFDERPVALVDLARSLCQTALKPTVDCSSYEGFNIFDRATVIPEDATYTIQAVKNAESDFHIDTHEPLELPRRGNFYELLNERLTSELLKSPPPCDEAVSVATGKKYNTGATDERTWVHWRDHARIFLKVLRPDCRAAALTIEFSDSQERDLAIADVIVNGARIPLEDVAEASSAGRRTVRIPLKKAAMENEHLTTEVRLAAKSPPAALTGFSLATGGGSSD